MARLCQKARRADPSCPVENRRILQKGDQEIHSSRALDRRENKCSNTAGRQKRVPAKTAKRIKISKLTPEIDPMSDASRNEHG